MGDQNENDNWTIQVLPASGAASGAAVTMAGREATTITITVNTDKSLKDGVCIRFVYPFILIGFRSLSIINILESDHPP